MEKMQNEIEEQNQVKQTAVEAAQKVMGTLKLLVSVCQKLHLTINPQADLGTDHTNVIVNIKRDIKSIIDKMEVVKEKTKENVSFYWFLEVIII